MKTLSTATLLVVCVAVLLALSATAFAGKKDMYFKGTSVDIIEQNLAIALKTPSPGMQASAAQVVRDLKTLLPDQQFGQLVIPLMTIVKDEDADGAVRTLAALALHELKSARGDFAIERVALFTSNERLRHLCGWLAIERMSKQPAATPASDLTDAR
jgi:hypothetical protein